MDLPLRIGRYRVRARLASGATAEVFLARASDAPDVAVKRLHPHLADDADTVAQLLDEARIAARLDHPAAVPVIDVGCEDGAWFLVFEHVGGIDLATLVARLASRGERMPAPVAVALTCELASVLAVLHALDDGAFVHGDLSPGNVLVSRAGEVRLVDLGACAALARGAPGVFGTPGYVAPEQARGDAVAASADVFSAGVILLELLTGEAAFPREGLMGLAATCAGARAPIIAEGRDLPRELLAVVARATAARPAERFATATELTLALQPFAASREEARAQLARAVADLMCA